MSESTKPYKFAVFWENHDAPLIGRAATTKYMSGFPLLRNSMLASQLIWLKVFLNLVNQTTVLGCLLCPTDTLP